MTEKYTCDHCGGTFNKTRDETWSDEKAMKEYRERFPDEPPDEPLSVICDDCYKIIMNQ